MTHHGESLRRLVDDDALVSQLKEDYTRAPLRAADKEMLDYVAKLTESPGSVDDGDVARLREAGFSAEGVWDVASVAAFYNLSNRLAVAADMRPNEAFYDFAREWDDD